MNFFFFTDLPETVTTLIYLFGETTLYEKVSKKVSCVCVSLHASFRILIWVLVGTDRNNRDCKLVCCSHVRSHSTGPPMKMVDSVAAGTLPPNSIVRLP